MSNRDPIRSARRKVARKERLGGNAFCLFCGYACLESLTAVSCRWLNDRGISDDRLERLLEEHHIHGQAHDPNLTVTLCLNCHREITEGLAREGVSMRPERNSTRRIALQLRASAVLLESLGTSYRRLATDLETDQENL